MKHEIRRAMIALAVAVSVIGIAAADLGTGDEIRLFPLYFLPLTLVAWHFGKGPAIVASVAMTGTWMGALYLGGSTYSAPYIWVVNFVAQGATFLVVTLLVAKLREAMLHEREHGRTDPLTGIANRRAFFDEGAGVLAGCNRHDRPATLAYLDLDDFKRANDRLGHAYGDTILRRVAEVLSGSLRGSDVVGRIGGDEFVMLLPETTPEAAAVALEKVRAMLSQDPLLAGAGVTASIGAINYETAPGDLDEMVRAADDVMYRVKASSKDRVHMEAKRAT